MQNNIFTNVSTGYGAVLSVVSGSILLENNTYIDSDAMGSATFAFEDTSEVVVRNLSHKNVNATETASHKYLHVKLKDGGNLTVEGIQFENMNLNKYRSILVEGNVDVYSLSALNYSGIEVGTENSMIEIKSFNYLIITN